MTDYDLYKAAHPIRLAAAEWRLALSEWWHRRRTRRLDALSADLGEVSGAARVDFEARRARAGR